MPCLMPIRVKPESFVICMSRPNATLVNGTEGCDAEAKTQLTSLVYVDYHDFGYGVSILGTYTKLGSFFPKKEQIKRILCIF